jgi:hypothetical protein
VSVRRWAAVCVVKKTAIATTGNVDLHLVEPMLAVYLGLARETDHDADLLIESVGWPGCIAN